MKKLLIVLAIMLFAVSAQAQTWHTANQVTVAWDAVAPIVSTDTIKYQVYVKFQSATAAPVAVGAEVVATQQAVTFATEGRYYLCVETVRYPAGETEAQRSDRMACSDVATDTATGTPFGVKYFTKPNHAGGLRVQ